MKHTWNSSGIKSSSPKSRAHGHRYLKKNMVTGCFGSTLQTVHSQIRVILSFLQHTKVSWTSGQFLARTLEGGLAGLCLLSMDVCLHYSSFFIPSFKNKIIYAPAKMFLLLFMFRFPGDNRKLPSCFSAKTVMRWNIHEIQLVEKAVHRRGKVMGRWKTAHFLNAYFCFEPTSSYNWSRMSRKESQIE